MAHIRLLSELWGEIQNDLRRPHAHAFERVGVLYGRTVATQPFLVLLHSYRPVADVNYVPDDTVGARINSEAIRSAIEASLRDGTAAFHVHLHDHLGMPGFSWDDEKSIARLAPSFQAVSPNNLHGALLLSRSDAIAAIWMPGARGKSIAASVTVVGWPARTTWEARIDGK